MRRILLMTLRRTAPLFLLLMTAAFGFALLMALHTAPRAMAGCTGGVGSGVIGNGGYVDQGCGQADQPAAIGAAPDAGTIIACRNISGCLSQAVNGPGGVSVPQRSTVVQQSQ
jgi:hypothetical protein